MKPPMFTGAEGNYITQAHARKYTKTYEKYGKRHPLDIKAHFFGKEAIEKLLGQGECVGLRVYYGMEDNGSRCAMIVGTRADGSDIISPTMADKDGDGSEIVESDAPCPNHCASPPHNGL